MTQRWYWYRCCLLARRWPRPMRRALLAQADKLYWSFISPVETFFWWLCHPSRYGLWLELQRSKWIYLLTGKWQWRSRL